MGSRDKEDAMPRKKRKKSSWNIYHVLAQGIETKTFNENQHKEALYHIIKNIKDQGYFELYGYCIMDDHYHLLLKEGFSLSMAIKKIHQKYAAYYNSVAKREGSVFYDRYQTEVVESEQSFLGVLRYIHLNPVYGGIVQDPYQYTWCSYKEFFYETPLMVDSYFVRDQICPIKTDFWHQFIRLHRETDYHIYLDTKNATKNQIVRAGKNIIEQEKGINHQTVKRLHQEIGLSYRQISQISGLKLYQVQNVLKDS